MKIKHRYVLRNKEIKQLTKILSSIFPNIYKAYLSENTISVEHVILDKAEIYIINGKPLIIRLLDGTLFPTISVLNEICDDLPKVFVDKGALPHIINGADVMIPGIVKIEGNFNEGEIVQILEINYNKIIAIGKALISSHTIHTLKNGKAFKNIHYVGDKLWEIIKTLN
ncbi:MAG: DUF1947 domain-containing protein [Nitrososphaeria archaeon]